MLDRLKRKLQVAANFASPPAIAMQIIALAGEPDIDLVKVAAAVSQDPGLTAKILRVANSSLYSKRRRSENLRQALVNLGLNVTTTLALSFSLVSAYKNGQGAGIDYPRFWRRAILSASAARTLGTLHSGPALEDLFLAGLLQDIAVLAIDRAQPAFYAGLPAQYSHADLCALERQQIGSDHAAVGGWLMRQWQLPESLCAVVEASHDPERIDRGQSLGLATRVIALASGCVEVLLAPHAPRDLQDLAGQAQAWLGMEAGQLAEVMASMVAEIPEIERLFEAELLDAGIAGLMLEQARELLTFRSMQALDQVSKLHDDCAHLEARTAELELRHRRDALTGVYNRGHLDEILEKEFRSAVVGGWPLSVVFADLDRFKRVNDTYGHPTGDSVLKATAQLLVGELRDEDVVARYGGEEFVIVLPGIGTESARNICDRLLARLRALQHEVAAGTTIRTTASLGLATHCAQSPFDGVGDLIKAADRCVYAAKEAGRDRVVCFKPEFARTA